MIRVYVPRDSAALSVGAEAVAPPSPRKRRRGAGGHLVRNGSRGLFWLEPMVEVETPAGRVAYGPVDAGDVPGLFDAGFLEGGVHRCPRPDRGDPYFENQERLTFARVGITDPSRSKTTGRTAAFAACANALALAPAEIVEEVTTSACAAAAARPFPPASSGGRCSAPRPTRSTSSATRTKATPAPSPTA